MTSYESVADEMADEATDAEKIRGTQAFLDSLGGVIGAIANVVQVAGWVFPAASTAAGLISALIGDQPKSDPALTAIQSAVTELIHGEHGLAGDLAVETITTRVNGVQTNLDLAANHGVGFFPDLGHALAHDAISLQRDLGTRVFWVRPHFTELDVPSFESGGRLWPDGHPPLEPDGQVFDPQLTHAAYVRAISMWLAALALVFPTGRPAELDEDLSSVIAALDGYRTEMAAGLRTFPAPRSVADVLVPVTDSDFQRGPWTLAGNLVSAFDVYTGRSVASPVWPWMAIDADWDMEAYRAMEAGFTVFLVGFALGGAVRRKALYVVEGMGAMWDTLQHLRTLAGQPTDTADADASWSLRELAGLVGPVLRTTDPAVVSGLDVLHALDVVAHRPPLVPGITENRSMRQALDAATP